MRSNSDCFPPGYCLGYNYLNCRGSLNPILNDVLEKSEEIVPAVSSLKSGVVSHGFNGKFVEYIDQN